MAIAFAFDTAFQSLTGHRPFGWQARLFEDIFADNHYDSCDIPTGLGKTSIIPIWLIALAMQAARPMQTNDTPAVVLPRRLVYVVNRRTVVDQATADAEKLRSQLHEAVSGPAYDVAKALKQLCVDPTDAASPLAISTLRGEFADNREWQADPARAAIIVGTVDMIGSRLLFSGYGSGRSSRRALAAGLLGHDAILVHDEAHLSQPFGRLVKEIARVQRMSNEPRPLRVLEMSATRAEGEKADQKIFELRVQEEEEEFVARRVNAKKALRIESVDSRDELIKKLSEAALVHSEENVRVLVFCHRVEDAKQVFDTIKGEIGSGCVELLTGTLRGYERDRLTRSEIFKTFKAGPSREELPASIYLVATSAGEVGVDLDADHMVCDLSTLDSMIQRLGRVSRLGREDQSFVSRIDVFDASDGKAKDGGEPGRAVFLEERRRNTAAALKQLPAREGGYHDASPRTLRALVDKLTAKGHLAQAFASTARIIPLTDILLDNWALTSVRNLPGLPAVHDWLHGKDSDPLETTVVWRQEANDLADLHRTNPESKDIIEGWFDAHRIEAQEKVSGPSYSVAAYFRALARRHEKSGLAVAAVLLTAQGRLSLVEIEKLSDPKLIASGTVILPRNAGGLEDGMLKDTAFHLVDDVADVPKGSEPAKRTRLRLLVRKSDDDKWSLEFLGGVSEDLERQGYVAPDTGELPDARSADRLVRDVLNALNRPNRADPFVEKERVVLRRDDDTGAVTRLLVSFGRAKRPETVLSASAPAARDWTLVDHSSDTRRMAVGIAASIGLDAKLAECLIYAAEHHDAGKDRDLWQKAIFNRRLPHLAKTAHGRMDTRSLNGYRHEFGSLIDATKDLAENHRDRFSDHDVDVILHLIAAHHGWARPHFAEQDDRRSDGNQLRQALTETPCRYARMQRRFGRWGNAWLEALMKAADVMATTNIAPGDPTMTDDAAPIDNAAAKEGKRA